MNIIQFPSAYQISGNSPDVIISSETDLTIHITSYPDRELQLTDTFAPDKDSKIIIPIEKLVSSVLKVNLPGDNVLFEQSDAVKTIQLQTSAIDGRTFIAIKGGVRDLSQTSEEFLRENFLTWQPQQKQIKAIQPEWLSYFAVEDVNVKVKAYFSDNTNEVYDLAALTAGKMYTMDLSFQRVNSLFEKQVTYYDVWVENSTPERISFIQRYILNTEYHDNEQFFIFENSLGGIDSVLMTGETKSKKKPKALIGKIDGSEIEYGMDFSVTYTQNTGHIDSRYKAAWLQDFFLSKSRNLVRDGVFLPIVMDKNAIKESTSEDIASFSFDFRLSKQSKYQNIKRSMDAPENLEISTPDSLFFLAPRLSEFPSLALSDTLTFPVMLRYTEEWGQISYATVKADLLAAVSAVGYVPGSEVGEHVDLSAYAKTVDLHEHSNKALLDGFAVDGNYLTVDDQEIWVANADRLGNIAAADYWTKNELVNDNLYLTIGADKIKAGYADLAYDAENLGGIEAADYWSRYNSNIPTVDWEMADAIVNGKYTTKNFAQGIVGGVGAQIDQSGHGEMKSLDLREFLRTPELIKNQVRVAGNQFWFTDPGLIKNVTGTGPYTLTLKIEEGDGVSFEVDDILIGIFNQNTGFETCYLDVISVDLQNNQILVNSRNGIDPRKFMQLARKGNETNPARQTSVYVDGLNGFLRVLGNVNDHNTTFDNIIAQLGYLNLTSPVFGHMEKGLYVKDNGYFENVRVSGDIIVTGGNAETLDGAQAKADSAEVNATGVANIAQGRADSAYAVAESKTNAWVTQITHNTVTAEYMRTLNLSVGDQIQMGANAVITWAQVSGTDNVETTAGAQAKVDALQIGGRNLALGTSESMSETGTGVANQFLSPPYTTVKFEEHGLKPTDVITISFNYIAEAISGDISGNIYLRPASRLLSGSMTYNSYNTSRIYLSNTNASGRYYKTFPVGEIFEILDFIWRLEVPTNVNITIFNAKVEIGNKATDWTPAPEDVDASISTAQGRADSAYAVAESKTNAWVTQITHDTITAEYMRTLNLVVGDQIQMGANAVITWAQVSGTENVETTAGAQAKVDAVEIGGTNLFLNSANACIRSYGGGTTALTAEQLYNAKKTIKVIPSTSTVSSGGISINSTSIEGSKTYTFSCMVYSNNTFTPSYSRVLHTQVGVSGVSNSHVDFNRRYSETVQPNGWVKMSVTFDIPDATQKYWFKPFFIYFNSVTDYIYVTDFKLEKGNKATAWTPAPEDVDASISTAQSTADRAIDDADSAQSTANSKITSSQATVITESTISTTNVIAQNLQVEAANIAGQLTASQINFDNAVGNNVTLTGHIEAETGFVGAFNISGTYLRGGSTIGGGFTGVELAANPPDEGYLRLYRNGSNTGSRVGITFGVESNPTESRIFSSASFGEYILGLNLVSEANIAVICEATAIMSAKNIALRIKDSYGSQLNLMNLSLIDNSHGSLKIGTVRRTQVEINGILLQEGKTSPNWSTSSSVPTQLILKDSYNSFYEDSSSGSAMYVKLPNASITPAGARIKIGTAGRNVYVVASGTSKLRWDTATKRSSGSYRVEHANRWTEWIMHGTCWNLCHQQNL